METDGSPFSANGTPMKFLLDVVPALAAAKMASSSSASKMAFMMERVAALAPEASSVARPSNIIAMLRIEAGVFKPADSVVSKHLSCFAGWVGGTYLARLSWGYMH